VNEEYDDIPSRVSSSHSRVDVLAFPVASLDEPKLRISSEDLDHFMLVNMVFSKEFIENLLDPDEPNDSHAGDSRRSEAPPHLMAASNDLIAELNYHREHRDSSPCPLCLCGETPT